MSYTIKDAPVGTHKVTLQSILYEYDPVIGEDRVIVDRKDDIDITVVE